MPVSHDHASKAHTHIADHDEPALVSRSVQAGLGLFVAVLVYSAAFGGLFGLAFAFAYGRTSGTLTPQALSALMAAAGFVAIYLVPNLKYPANPPAVGSHETIGIRTALFAHCHDRGDLVQASLYSALRRVEREPDDDRILHRHRHPCRLAPPGCE